MHLGHGAGRLPRPLWLISLLALLCTSCSDDASTQTRVELSGRVFAAETGKALSKVVVVAPSGTKAASAADGTFKVSYGSKRQGSLIASAADAAPLRKPAPKAGGYIELYVKGYDAQQNVDPLKGGAALTADGAQLKVGGSALQHKGRSKAPTKTRLSVAAPQPKRPTDLPAIPGNFDAKEHNKRGKLSTESPVYVSAHDGDQELELKNGEKAGIDLPVRAKQQKGAGDTRTLYRYDEAEDLWVEAGTVEETTNEAGTPIYRGEISALGWWAVGEFYDQLTCVRGCVENANADPAAGARIVVSGLDHDSQVTTYAGSDGCYALDVRAGAQISISAQTADAFAGPTVLATRSEPGSAQDAPSACQALEPLRLVRREVNDCPLGLSECGELCVDTSLDSEHCGACDSPCENTTCVAGACTAPPTPDAGMPEADAGMADAGSALDAETPDAGPPPQARLTVVTDGDGAGSINSTPSGIDCGDLCDALFPLDTQVTLVATQDTASSTFGGWGGDCAGNPEPTCTLSMDAARSASATFSLLSHSLSVSTDGTGTGSVVGDLAGATVINCGAAGQDCSESVLHGSFVTLTAQPSTYNVLATWGGACAGAQGSSCTVSITDAVSVSATFSLVQYTLTVRAITTFAPPAEGTVTSSPAGISCTNTNAVPEVVCTAVFDAGTPVQLTASTGGYFDSWGGDCTGSVGATCDLTLNADADVSADFAGVIF